MAARTPLPLSLAASASSRRPVAGLAVAVRGVDPHPRPASRANIGAPCFAPRYLRFNRLHTATRLHDRKRMPSIHRHKLLPLPPSAWKFQVWNNCTVTTL